MSKKDTLDRINRNTLPFDWDSVLPQCHECIQKQLEKYEKAVDKDGNAYGDKFVVPCKGIPKSLESVVDPAWKSSLSEEDWKAAEEVSDITKWAEQNLLTIDKKPWKARWYQSEILRCTSRRKVLRCSRRVGKTDLVCVEICYYLFTQKNIRIVVGGPQKSHVEEIFKRIRAFISRNPLLSTAVAKSRQAPYQEIELTNGACVRGFSVGSKGKVQGLSVRGQDAHRIYCEEMDYIDEKALAGAVLPILFTSPNTALVGFSTPTGFPTPYYKLCEENPHYKEFHYNYKVLPWWREVEMERANLTEDEWTHEYEAEWGSSEQGVYRVSYIDRALTNYNYEGITRIPTWRYAIGTDWNEIKGAQIVVLGTNTMSGHNRVVEAVHVERSEYTQLDSVDMLLKMNEKWKPATIYIDAGNGSTNYELLRKTSQEARRRGNDPDKARILDILKKYDSGAAIKIRDPVGNEERKVPAKPFMVNASIRMFEQGRIDISMHDKVLEGQLRNYIVERITPTKVPVYGCKQAKIGDHRLDALNLAIVACHLEFDDLHKRDFVKDAGAMPDPRKMVRNQQLRDRSFTKSDDTPEGRRLEENEPDDLIAQAKRGLRGSSLPARVDVGEDFPSNRPGWDTDEEEKRHQQYMQRRRSRQRTKHDMPVRRMWDTKKGGNPYGS
jgi:hypothetical protein